MDHGRIVSEWRAGDTTSRAWSHGAMAGYSGTPLPGKLGIKPGHRLALVGAPAAFAATLGALPPGVLTRTDLRGRELDVVVLFATARAELERRFSGAAARLAQAGGLWIAWPKKASGVATDLTEGVVREVGPAAGLVDNKVCAIDEVWSGLRFVIRLVDRKGRPGRLDQRRAWRRRRGEGEGDGEGG
jgi:hypothetical protein